MAKPKRVYSVPDFSRFCGELVLDSGKKLKLESFQRTLLRDYFHGATETVAILPKKNGKTTLLAALALYHLRKTEQAECVIAASSRDQAKILFNQAVKMVRASGLEGEFDVKGGYREIRYRGDENWVMRVLAADADTADGVIPTLALVDELHRHKSAELYGVFADGLGPRAGQLITISTAGDNHESPLGEMRAQAYEYGVDRVGPYRRAAAPDGDFVLHEWALDEGDDLDDLGLVAEANPAPWQTEKALARRKDKPSMTPWRWKRFACGIWTDSEEPWIAEAEWDECEGDVELPDVCFLGIDIGQIYDSSAVVTAGWVDGKLHVKCRIWTPEPERPIRIEEVERHVVEEVELRSIGAVAYDPARFNRSAEALEERGILMVSFPQTNTKMVPASNTLYDLIREGQIVHDGDMDFRRHVLAGVASEVENGWRISKKRSKAKIDALVALALAAAQAVSFKPAGDPVVEVFG